MLARSVESEREGCGFRLGMPPTPNLRLLQTKNAISSRLLKIWEYFHGIKRKRSHNAPAGMR